jgi:hypothetical protein
MKSVWKSVAITASIFCMSMSHACPDGQYSTCIVPTPFGCAVTGCVPKAGGDIATTIENAKRAVTEDPVKIIVNPTALINTTGIPATGDVFEFVVKNPEKIIELAGQPANWPYVPVATAIISARNAVVNSGGKRIPHQIKQKMRRWYSDDLLNSVRWTTNWGPLMSTIQSAQMSFNSQTQAIALINAVIFRDDDAVNDLDTWAHELFHVQQYREKGVFGFAREWTNNSSVNGPIEAPAYQRGREAAKFYGSSSESLPSTAPVPPQPPTPTGLFSGTVLRGCGCWGYVQLEASFPWNACQSGGAVHRACLGMCPTGGAPYATICF